MEGDSSDAGTLPGGATEEVDTAPGKVRKKMAVGEGRSLMHWLNQRPNVKRQRWVTMDEVKTHNTASDAWTVFRGKVYHLCVCVCGEGRWFCRAHCCVGLCVERGSLEGISLLSPVLCMHTNTKVADCNVTRSSFIYIYRCMTARLFLTITLAAPSSCWRCVIHVDVQTHRHTRLCLFCVCVCNGRDLARIRK